MRPSDRRNTPSGPILARRTLFASAAAACLAAPADAAVPPSDKLAFRALRNGSAIGTHHVSFRADGDAMIVTIAVDYLVKFGPIPLFRYTLRGTETWRSGVLMSTTNNTNNNGNVRFMRATRDGDSLLVEGSRTGRYRAPRLSIAASHWNPREIEAPMINPEDGELMDFIVTRKPEEMVALADGQTVEARHYALAGPNLLDLWYDRTGVWSALRATAKDGSIITYVRLA